MSRRTVVEDEHQRVGYLPGQPDQRLPPAAPAQPPVAADVAPRLRLAQLHAQRAVRRHPHIRRHLQPAVRAGGGAAVPAVQRPAE